ncbi:MAG TPA: AAA family ATPase, partial [Dehalococcoidia bacterium]|nr:AAA family ATPase [Dehalococcoidia bacterium]
NPLDRLAGGIFVGRDKEMDELRAGLEDSLSGRGRLMMLVGEPGIGKTRTSEEFATYARLRNVQVLWGRCYEGEGAPAYWPWVQIIRSYAHEKEPKELMSEMGPGAADIAQVVSEVRDRLPGLPVPPALEPEQARFRLFDSITTFLKNASKAAPLMVVLDDLHWADKPSLLLLQFLAKELRGSRLMVLGTYRDVELRRQHPLAQTLGELNRENLSQRIILRGLTEHDVHRFIEITAGTAPPDALVQGVYRETEGNPFFVNEIVRLLVADGRLEHPEAVKQWSLTIPQSVREVVGRRLDHLSEECNRILTIGSVIGREFGLKLLDKVSDVKGDRLREALEEALGARVIGELPRTTDQYWFSHALIRETLYEELSTTRRIRLHRQIGEALEELYGDNPEGHLAELSHHFSEAAQGGDVDKAVDYAVRAAERATGLVAYEEAVVHYAAALQAVDLKTPPDESRRCDLLRALGEAQFMAGDSASSKASFDSAIELARMLKDAERLGRAANAVAVHFFEIGISREPVVHLLEEALAAVKEEESTLKVRLLSNLARELYFSPMSDRRPALVDEAVAMARRLGDPAAVSYALLGRLFGAGVPQEDRLAIESEMIGLAEETGDRVQLLIAHHSRLMTVLARGDIAEVDREIRAHSEIAQELRQQSFLWQDALFPAMRALVDGRIDDAERLAQAALAVGQRAQGVNAMQLFGAQIFAIRREQGRTQEVEPIARGMVEQFPAVPAWRAGLAFIHADLGREKEAREQFDLLAQGDFAAFPRDGNWPIAMALLAEVCAFLKDADRAALLYEELRPWEGFCIMVGPAIDSYGAVSRLMAMMAATMKHWEVAERHFEDALERNARMGFVRWTTRTRLQYAMMLAKRDAPGDRQKALALLAPALDDAQRLGLKRDLEDCLALKLKLQGIDLTDIGTSIDTVAREALAEQPDLKPHAAPDGTVTIMFSDIEGSTALTERLGDQRWMEVLREHNNIVRDQLKAYGGFEVKSEGDGFMVAFQSARRALDCASAIQKALAERNNGHEEAVRVRMGLHAGEVIKEGDDFFGRNVIMAARVASQANGGEILASGVLRTLLAGSDVTWGKKRTAELKGLAGKHEIWPVLWG